MEWESICTKKEAVRPPWGGDETLKIMEQIVLKLHNLTEQLHLLADSPHIHGRPSISNHMLEAYVTDSLPGRIF